MTDPLKLDPTTDVDPELDARLDDDATATAEDLDNDSAEPSNADLHPVGGMNGGTADYSLPEDDNPANQDEQSASGEIGGVAQAEADFPVSGDVTGGRRGSPGSDAMAGAGVTYDDGVPAELRVEMLDNAAAFGADHVPNNVNDDPSFDDGTPGSFSDFSVMTEGGGEAPRLADPSHDTGGEVKGARVGGSGGIDGGPARTTPLPGAKEID